MKSKIHFFSTFFFILSVLFSCGPSERNGIAQKAEYEALNSEALPVQDGKQLPDFLFIPMDSLAFTGNDIPKGKSVWVMNFNPGCAHCQQTALAISMRKDELKNTEFIFVSRVATDAIKKFATDYKLWEQEGVHFFQDPKQLFFNYFGIVQVPLVMVYNEEHQLLQTFETELDFEDILSTVQAHKKQF